MSYLRAVCRLEGCYSPVHRRPHDARGPVRCCRCWQVMA